MTEQIVITDYNFPHLDQEKKIFETAGFEMLSFKCKTELEVMVAGENAAGLLVQWAPVTEKVIRRLKCCRLIVRYGIGTDNVDLEAAKRAGIVVCNIPHYCLTEVAEHTLALVFSLLRQLSSIDQLIRQGHWQNIPPGIVLPFEKLNFVSLGFGKIAKQVIHRASIFGCNLFAYDPFVSGDEMMQFETVKVTLDEAFKIADVLVLHLPLTESTRHIINLESLLKMKKNAIIVNTSRGALIDTITLADFLSNDLIGGAGLDVFENEPLPLDHPIREAPNVILTSHVAWYSEESIPKLQKLAAEEMVSGLTGKKVRNRVA